MGTLLPCRLPITVSRMTLARGQKQQATPCSAWENAGGVITARVQKGLLTEAAAASTALDNNGSQNGSQKYDHDCVLWRVG